MEAKAVIPEGNFKGSGTSLLVVGSRVWVDQQSSTVGVVRLWSWDVGRRIYDLHIHSPHLSGREIQWTSLQ